MNLLRRFFGVILAALAFALSAPAVLANQMRTENVWWLPDVVTHVGVRVDALFVFITVLTVVVFVLVMIAMIYFMIKYRVKRGVGAIYSHGNNTIEIVWTIIPAIVFIGIVLYGNGLWDEITNEKFIPKDALNIEITAEQYGYYIRYPGPDNILGKADDLAMLDLNNKLGLDMTDPRNSQGFATYNQFNMPANRPVRLHLRSRDVIHSFYVPEFRVYQDMVPGRTISWLWFEAFKTGNFVIACNQLCGAGHWNMQSKITVMTPEDYQKWYESKLPKPTASALPISTETSAAQP